MWRTAGDLEVDRHDVTDGARDGVPAGKNAAVACSVTQCDHEAWLGHREVGPLEG